MDFKYVLDSNWDKKEILLGYTNEEHLNVDIKRYPSIIITGETGSGKSILLDQILIQLISKYTSVEMGIIAIDTSGVELNYYVDSNYALFSAINDEEKALVAITRVLKEIDRRKEILLENGYKTVEEYNQNVETKLPLLVIAIDDDKFLLHNHDIENMLSTIITQISGLNMLFILVTSDVHNKFFETDRNTLASILITFDYTNPSEAKKANLLGADALSIGKFMARIDKSTKVYNNYDFDDSIIYEVLNK